MSKRMHAITIDPQTKKLKWEDTARPAPSAHQVLIRSHATAVNRADLVQRAGLYPPPAGASEILGLEVAGVVVEVGQDVDSSWIGKRVCALIAGGGYGEFVAVDEQVLYVLPDHMDFVHAAAFPEVFTTAYVNLFMEAQLQSGESLLLHAAASGVGTAAIQMCKQHDIQVFATASTSKQTRLQQMGVHRAIDRHKEHFLEVIKETTQNGVDVILDPVGGSYLDDNLKCLKKQGRMVLIGLMGGRRAEINLGLVLVKRLSILGSVLRSRAIGEKRIIAQRMREEVWPLFVDGTYKAIIHETFAIQDAEEAHELIDSNTTVGKVVLTFPE